MKNGYDKIFDEVFAEYFTNIRKDKGIKRRRVATYIGINENTLAYYEYGTRPCPLSVFKKMCTFYGLDFVEVFTELDRIATDREKQWMEAHQ